MRHEERWHERLGSAAATVRRWVAARELVTLLLVAALAGGVFAFIEIADAVREEETRALDEAILLAMRRPGDPSDPIGPPWIEEVGRDLTALGGVTIIGLVTAAVAATLWLVGQRRSAMLLVFAVVSGALLSFALKRGFDRPRPALVPHETTVYTASFPSGHSMLSAVAYLTLGALVARVLPRKRLKAFVLGWALLFTGLAGASRVYLGVHWPTDVLAGWAIGASWAVACWLAADLLDRPSTSLRR
ncbi:MAG TPA: phosphatase PAP2 family protein [Anaeromyxobacter sp.]|nr:phosphatase PAP2 family protein [Anaeromyxobacter sp.]